MSRFDKFNQNMFCFPSQTVNMKFREASYDVLSDFLTNLNKINKIRLRNLTKCDRNIRNERLTECIFLITKELNLDPAAGYQAVEILQKFIVKHLSELLNGAAPQGAAVDSIQASEDGMFDTLKEKFPLLIFSCVQLSSKLTFLSHSIDNDTAVRFLHSVGHSVSKKAVLDSELMVLKGLEFRVNDPNPLTYVEVLLEVLGNNQPSIPVERLYELCHHVLQFVSLDRNGVFKSLLVSTTQCASPSEEQREKFVAVTEDYMLLGVGVIAVASFIHSFKKWKTIVEELSHITGISTRSISDFAHATLKRIVGGPSSM